MMTHLEHEGRGKRRKYEIAYKGSGVRADESTVAEELRTIWRETYVTCRNQRVDKHRDDGLGTFQAL